MLVTTLLLRYRSATCRLTFPGSFGFSKSHRILFVCFRESSSFPFHISRFSEICQFWRSVLRSCCSVFYDRDCLLSCAVHRQSGYRTTPIALTSTSTWTDRNGDLSSPLLASRDLRNGRNVCCLVHVRSSFNQQSRHFLRNTREHTHTARTWPFGSHCTVELFVLRSDYKSVHTISNDTYHQKMPNKLCLDYRKHARLFTYLIDPSSERNFLVYKPYHCAFGGKELCSLPCRTTRIATQQSG